MRFIHVHTVTNTWGCRPLNAPVSLRQEALTVFIQCASAWSTDKRFTLSSRQGSPPIDHTQHTRPFIFSTALQTFTNNTVSCPEGCALFYLTSVSTLNFTHRRSCWKSRNTAALWFMRGHISFSRFMCSVCLLVSRLIAVRGFTGGYRLCDPRAFLLLCASHGYRCALAEPHQLLDLNRQNRIKNRWSVSYLSQQFL